MVLIHASEASKASYRLKLDLADATEVQVLHVYEVGHLGVGVLLAVGVVPDAKVTFSKNYVSALSETELSKLFLNKWPLLNS